jgi:hypothetical protein
MPTLDNFVERIERMGKAIGPYAKAKSERVYIENYLRSKKSLLMALCDEKTMAAKEAFAYAHPEYIELLHGLKQAVEVEEKAKWALERFKIEVEVWRTQQANDRWMREKI